ncbi:unnamed protein product [Haemonchus placei]|uniref:Uncharacterized protein n=1 Tax=Haemonchus placei TaxID=6290 RepID=A0A0N4VTJ7_HAEPC|nr:unnamed protein product [Haemonchus placei]
MQILYVFFVLLSAIGMIFATPSLAMSPRFKRQFGNMGMGGYSSQMQSSQMGASQMGGGSSMGGMGGWGR